MKERHHVTEATFAANPTAPARARAFVEANLVSRMCTKGAALAVSELVTNVVRHEPMSTELTVTLDVTQTSVHIEVSGNSDRSAIVTSLDAWPDPSIVEGRGLGIVEALSDRWGVDIGKRRAVWCEIPCE